MKVKMGFVILLVVILLSTCGCSAINNGQGKQPEVKPNNEKNELIMATIGSSRSELIADRRVIEMVNEFNASQDLYHITIVNFNTGETGNTAVGEEQGMARLFTELAAGQYPDLICFDNISPYPFIANGMLLDMESYMSNDADIRIEDIVAYKALRAWGGVYLMSNHLSPYGLCALRSRFGDRIGWTIQEYLEIEDSLPEGSFMLYNTTREMFLETMVMNYLGTAIDWEKGTCDFNNPDFTAILEASRRIHEDNSGEVEFGIGGLQSLEAGQYIAMFYGPAFPHELAKMEPSLTPIGWPTVDGRCGTMVYYQNPIGIMKKSSHLDGAWAFIKYLLMTPDGSNMRLPTWRPLLEDALLRAQHSETFPSINEEQASAFLDLMDHVEIFYQHDPVVLRIIMDECSTFLAGERSAEDTAALIQSKMQIYVGERWK